MSDIHADVLIFTVTGKLFFFKFSLGLGCPMDSTHPAHAKIGSFFSASRCRNGTKLRHCHPVWYIDVKTFLKIHFGHVFYVFNVFLFSKRFLFLKKVGKVQSGKQINKKHLQNNQLN